MATNGVRYGNKSQSKYEINRRAKKRNITVDELLKIEQEEQDKINKGYLWCNSCKSWKIFGKAKTYCKECCAKRVNLKYDKEKQKIYLLKKKYNLTLEDYNGMRDNQNYKCYICNIDEEKLDRALAVDHCHTTGQVRGLLCGSCNRFLGQINDNVETAERMVHYLKTFKKITKKK